MPARRCSEPGCNKSLEGMSPKAITCSRSCGEKRRRRLARMKKAAGSKSPYPPEVQDVAEAARHEAKDIAAELTREELRPVVREALTEDVLNSLGDMVRLVPTAIGVIADGLENGDPQTKQRYAELVMRYTLGHKSIAPASAEQAPAPMTVNLLIPASGSDPTQAQVQAALPGEADELKQCVECGNEKPAPEFVAGSDRCQTCDDDFRAKVQARFAT